MFEWKCHHCGKRFYSSSAERESEYINCCYCGKKIENPYCKKEAADEESIT